MSFIGDLLGYDEFGHDLMGAHRDDKHNCIVCGRSAMLHSPEQSMICLGKLWRKDEAQEAKKDLPSKRKDGKL